jgi:hypothetical protein
MAKSKKKKKKKDRPGPYKKLRRFNGVMGSFHFIQGALMLVLGLTVNNIKDFRLPLNVSFLTLNENIGMLVSETREVAAILIGPAVSLFLFLSAIAHFIVVMPGAYQVYRDNLKRGINYFRWFEYALSSSLMIVLIAMFFGVYDLGSLILIAGLNAAMNLLGLMMELYNQKYDKAKWAPFIMGCFAGAVPWAIILMHFLGSGEFSQIPWFVYVIFGSYLVFFNLFPVNMVLQYKKKGKWKDYLFGERMYIVLSLTAKTVLAWFVFAGTVRPV